MQVGVGGDDGVALDGVFTMPVGDGATGSANDGDEGEVPFSTIGSTIMPAFPAARRR